MPLGSRAGHATHWQVFGSGSRPALAIHCSLAHSGAWSGVASRLADRITLTAFDMPGHGKSADLPGESDFLILTTRIAASFIERPVDLIGHSFGAVAALRLAIAAPEAIRTLTLVEPVLFAAARGSAELDNHAKEMAEFDAAIAAGRVEEAAARFTVVWGTGADWQEMNARSRSEAVARIHMIEAGAPALYDDSGGILAPDALESLDMPVLLIRGDRSPAVIERITEEIAGRLPDVGVATVPGAGHMAPTTHPEAVAGLVGVNLDRG